MPSRPHRLLAALWLAAAALLPAGLAAQTTPYAVPEAPAFTFLGTTPADVARPVTARALATSVLQAVDSLGRVQQGLAVDLAPWTLVPGLALPLTDYQRSRRSYALANTQLSLATLRTAGDSAATDLALGLRVTLFDRSDPLASPLFTDTLRARLDRRCSLPDQPFADEADAAAPHEACLREVRAAWLAEWREGRHARYYEETLWNRPGLALAAAAGWRLEDARLSRTTFAGWSAWATGALPLPLARRRGLLLAQLRYDHRAALAPAPAADLLRYGARALLGRADYHLFTEITGRSDLTHHRTRAEWAAGIEFRVGETLWLATGLQSGFTTADGADRVAVAVDMRWDVARGK